MTGPGVARQSEERREPAPPAGNPLQLVPMPRAVFCRFSQLIQEECGIKMPDSKKTMLEARLRKRLRALGLATFEEYSDYCFREDGLGHELVHLLDVVTTNKTDFFREAVQFEHLLDAVLPELVASGRGCRSALRLWSAGCSTGEEAYTLAMVLAEFRQHTAAFSFEILATDLSTRVLEAAARGIYRAERVEPVPVPLRHKYLLRSRDRREDLVRVCPELRGRVRFQRLNFMEFPYAVGNPMDLIFCRNVLIYFEKEFQRRLLLQLCEHLAEGGYLFLGHTESVHGMNLPVQPVGSSIYRKAG